VTSAPEARTALATNSRGVFTFTERVSAARNSGEVRRVVTTARMSPPVLRNVAAARSTTEAGGSSATKRRASLVEMNRAVAGWVASMCRTFSPSFWPPPLMTWPRISFSLPSWMRSSKTNSGWSWRRPRMVQPVKHRATSVTSFCV